MLEALGKLAHGPRELTGDRIPRATGRRRMMRLIENEQRARPKLTEHVPQAGDVVLLGQQAVGDDEARTGASTD